MESGSGPVAIKQPQIQIPSQNHHKMTFFPPENTLHFIYIVVTSEIYTGRKYNYDLYVTVHQSLTPVP